jgi:large subunit ribosomal protein L4e
MKVPVFDLQGKEIKKIDLPKIFEEPVREDLIWRAFLATLSKKRQAYGVDVYAGKKTSAHYHGKRRLRHDTRMMGRGMARVPRLHGRTAPHLLFEARVAPQVRKGRKAHPPKAEKVWTQKINKKERKKAIRSAIVAAGKKKFVLKRGHKVKNLKQLPLVTEDKIENLSKTKDLVEFLKKIGLKKELDRIKKRKIRPGKGKARGRKYKIKTGPLMVVTKDKGISKAARNLSGVDVCRVENLSAEILAPGASPGRLAIFTLGSIKKLK